MIAKQSQNVPWKAKVLEQSYANESIRRVSIDKFYELVFNDPFAFAKLCRALPKILDDVIEETQIGTLTNSVYDDLHSFSSDTFKSLYLLAFQSYQGFSDF